MNHTSGQWITGDKDPGVVTANGEGICVCVGPIKTGTIEGNAQLITAAPDYYEAAEMIRLIVEEKTMILPRQFIRALGALLKAHGKADGKYYLVNTVE